MAVHAEDTLRRPSIAQVLNLSLAIPTLEAIGAKSLVTSENRKILYLVSTVTAAVRAVVTY